MEAPQILSTFLVILLFAGAKFPIMCFAARYTSDSGSVSTSPFSGPLPISLPPLYRPLLPVPPSPSLPFVPIIPLPFVPPFPATRPPSQPSAPTIAVPSMPPFPGTSPPSLPFFPGFPFPSMPPFPSTSPPSSPLVPGFPLPSRPPFPSTSPPSPPQDSSFPVPLMPPFPSTSPPCSPQRQGVPESTPVPSMPPFSGTSPPSPPFAPGFPVPSIPPFPATSPPSPPFIPFFPVPSMPPFPAIIPPYIPLIPPSISPSMPPVPASCPPSMPSVPVSSPPSPFMPSIPISSPPMMPPAPVPQSMTPVPASIPYPDTPVPAPGPASKPSAIKAAYWPSWLAGTVPSSSIPTAYFTHIFYAFGVPDSTSFQLNISQADEQLMINFISTIRSKRHATKTMLSIGGDAGSPILSSMTSSYDNRAAFIQSTINLARRCGFDGLDLDWEFPLSTQNMDDLALLFKEWRKAISIESLLSSRPPLILSAAAYFSSNVHLSGVFYPGDAIRKYVDFLNPMCYNYHGAWDTSATGAPSLVYDKSSNISTSYGISSWKQNGVPSEKLVMGIPLYGNSWKLKDPNDHGIGAPAVGVGLGTQGIMSYDDIVTFNSQNNTNIVYDYETVSAYSYAGTNWIGYDDINSIIAKIKYAKAQGLGGYFFWMLGYDSKWILPRAASMAWDDKI